MTDESRSAWFYVGLGCGGCALLVGVLAIVTVVGGIRFARSVERDLEDPVARTEKAKVLLGTDGLPEGYQAVMSLSVPFVFEMVILADKAAEAGHGLADDTEKLFIYVELIRGDRNWREYASGGGDPSDVLSGQGLRMRGGSEEIGRGTLVSNDSTVDYVSRRGTLNVEDDPFDGIVTFLFVRCEGSKKMRVGVWANRDPAPDARSDELDLRGTCADPQRIESFLRPLDLCG
ncbi:MAG TPA: hypothetical protein VD788_00185 [Candidatus Polarisedimenticolaceae bacterium]|nr:hypothetical protein [Candidatus Polarisedimenticolaceae bacterium]